MSLARGRVLPLRKGVLYRKALRKLDHFRPRSPFRTIPLPARDIDNMLALSHGRELRAQWQRAAELLLAEADVADFSKQIELALFYDAKLVLAA
jgi:hypothetical protein